MIGSISLSPVLFVFYVCLHVVWLRVVEEAGHCPNPLVGSAVVVPVMCTVRYKYHTQNRDKPRNIGCWLALLVSVLQVLYIYAQLLYVYAGLTIVYIKVLLGFEV